MEVELRVSREEFQRIRQERRELEKRFYELEKLENTLRALRFRHLLEHRERLRRKLEEMKHHYEELIEFEKKAQRDKELLFEIRRKLSHENAEFRRELGVRMNEDRGET
ncbi:hypothetical protein JCM16138_15550 [Thermococcus atlanticus]